MARGRLLRLEALLEEALLREENAASFREAATERTACVAPEVMAYGMPEEVRRADGASGHSMEHGTGRRFGVGVARMVGC